MDGNAFTGYKPLDPVQNEIRIVTLAGVTDDDGGGPCMISCTLEKSSLADASPFHALSYVWGSPEDERPVLIDGQIVKIRNNLWQFLEQLCRRFQGLRVWLDYVCINQQDVEERNSQVRMMDEIYHSADSVYAWLGPSTVDSDEFFGIVSAKSSDAALSQRDAHAPSQNAIPAKAFADMSERSYWTRLWIIQEFLLPQHLWLFCGSGVIHWKDLEAAVHMHFQRLRIDRSASSMNIMSANTLRTLLKLRSAYRENTLSALVREFAFSKCQDSRDRIYGLLSLVDKSEASMITIDYKKPLLQVFLETCKLWSEDLAGELKETGSGMNEACSSLAFTSVYVFCGAMLKMMTAEDLMSLQHSASARQTVTTRCSFASSSSPTRITKVCTVGAITKDGGVEPFDPTRSHREHRGYVSAFKGTASIWRYVYTNSPIAVGNSYITFGYTTLLVLRSTSDQHQSHTTQQPNTNTAIVAGGIVMNSVETKPTGCTRTLAFQHPRRTASHILPDAAYSIIAPNPSPVQPIKKKIADTRPWRPTPPEERTTVQFNTDALVSLLLTYKHDQQPPKCPISVPLPPAPSARDVDEEFHDAKEDDWDNVRNQFGNEMVQVSDDDDESQPGQSCGNAMDAWNPWKFGLEYGLLRPCLKCKMMDHRVRTVEEERKWNTMRCDCDWGHIGD